MGDKIQVIMIELKNQCGMLSVMGANDDIHIAITKPFGAFVEDYYYHKIGGYSIVAQAMDDNQT